MIRESKILIASLSLYTSCNKVEESCDRSEFNLHM